MHAIKCSRFNERLPAACLRRVTNVQFTRPNPNMSARAHRVARGTYPLRAPKQTTCAKNKHCCSKASAWHEEFKLDSTSLSDKLTPLGHEATASRLLSSKDPTKRHSVSTGQHWWTCSRGRLDTLSTHAKTIGECLPARILTSHTPPHGHRRRRCNASRTLVSSKLSRLHTRALTHARTLSGDTL